MMYARANSSGGPPNESVVGALETDRGFRELRRLPTKDIGRTTTPAVDFAAGR
jgi:hypothetical protein